MARLKGADLALRLVSELVLAHRAGSSIGVIVRDLTGRGVPTDRGGVKWCPSTVKSVLDRQDAAALATV